MIKNAASWRFQVETIHELPLRGSCDGQLKITTAY